MKPCFKVKNQNLVHGDFTEANVTYWGVHSEEKKVKENNNNKNAIHGNFKLLCIFFLERQQTPWKFHPPQSILLYLLLINTCATHTEHQFLHGAQVNNSDHSSKQFTISDIS